MPTRKNAISSFPFAAAASYWLLVWGLFHVRSSTATSVAVSEIDSQSASTNSIIINNNNNNNVVTFALIPHHVQQRRRQLESGAKDFVDAPPLDPYQQRRRRRHRRLDSQVLDALYQGYGTHYVDLWCGTPTPQRQTVIVDTGSGVTAFPCLGCQNCGDDGHHIDSLFNQSSSVSFDQLNCTQCQRGHCGGGDGSGECRFGMSYQEGSSWSAFEAVDICYAGGPHDHALAISSNSTASSSTTNNNNNNNFSSSLDEVDPRLASSFAFRMTFGCQTRLTGLFKTQLADGIMGMDNADTAFWSQMQQAGKIKDKVFSLCFSRQDTVNRQGTQAGAMTLGGTDPRLHTSPMVYATNVNGQSGASFFAVHVRRIYLRQGGGGDSASSTTNVKVVALDVSEQELNRGTTIVDSGTTDTYFSTVIASSLSLVWKELTGSTFSHNPVKLTTDQLNQLPTLLFQLAGEESMNGALLNSSTTSSVTGLAGSLDTEHPLDIILAVPPSHYMEFDDHTETYFNRFYADEGSGGVLGANAMMGHDVFFDVPNARIGFSESLCDYPKLLAAANVSTDHPSNGGSGSDSPAAVKKEVPGSNGGDSHDGDTPGSDVKETQTKSPQSSTASSSSTSSSTSCDSLRCRGAIVAGLVGVLLLGLVVGRAISGRRQRFHPLGPQREYQLTSELELSNVVAEDDEDYVQYQDQRNSRANNGSNSHHELSEKIIC